MQGAGFWGAGGQAHSGSIFLCPPSPSTGGIPEHSPTSPSTKNTHGPLPPGTGSDHPNSAVLHLKGLDSAPWFKCRASKREPVLRVSSCPMGAREPGVPGSWSTRSTRARTRVVVLARGKLVHTHTRTHTGAHTHMHTHTQAV